MHVQEACAVQAEKVGCETLCYPNLEVDAVGAFPEADMLRGHFQKWTHYGGISRSGHAAGTLSSS